MSTSDVANVLRSLEREGGKLIPEDVVEAARDPDSPLRAHFTWDDSEAAVKQRLHEARRLIRTVKIEVSVRSIPLATNCYVRDPDNSPGYRNIVAVRAEEDTSRAVIIDEMARVASAVKRAKRVAAMLGTQQDLEQIEALASSVTAKVTEMADTLAGVQ